MKSIFFHTIVFVFAFYLTNIIWDFVQYDNQYCTIELEHGRIRGKLNRTLFDGKLFYSFRGIPFASPPVGDLRFKTPRINDVPWSGLLDAFDFGNDCFQHISDDIFDGSEDCLYLNVFVPINTTGSINPNAKLPVIFYIYGGRFVTGAASDYAPDFLIEENVIVVTSNHRVGPLGFLALDLPEYSGNMGLKDQALALKWTHEYIGHFGGDKNQITIAGHSSGSVSVQLHMISPQSNHLFRRAIMLSGTALARSGPNRDDTSYLFNLAEQLNYSISNEYDLVKFLNAIDADLLLRKTYEPLFKYPSGSKVTSRRFEPVVEDGNAINPFLTEQVFETFIDAKFRNNIDTLSGISNNEVILTEEQLQPELLNILDEVFEFDLPLGRATVDHKSELYKTIAKRIRDFYFDGKNVSNENIQKLNMLLSDISFLYGTDLSARILAKHSYGRTIYLLFTVDNDWNLSARKRKESNFTAHYDAHADQVYYLFWFSRYTPNEIYQNLDKNSVQRKIIKNIASFYANFAKYGNPMPSNEATEYYNATTNQFKYYEIANEGIFVRIDKNRDRINFWDNLFDEFKHHWNITFDFRHIHK